jgi:hypothetical protein
MAQAPGQAQVLVKLRGLIVATQSMQPCSTARGLEEDQVEERHWWQAQGWVVPCTHVEHMLLLPMGVERTSCARTSH